MAIGRLKRVAYIAALMFGTLLWLTVLLLFSQVAQNSEEFARLQPWILLINIVGIAVLLLLIIGNFIRLISDYRRHVPGARLKARMMIMLVVLTVLPLLIVYTFAGLMWLLNVLNFLVFLVPLLLLKNYKMLFRSIP